MGLTEAPGLGLAGLFLLGLIFLFAGGHTLVQGSSRLARIMGVHPIIVGLTIVSIGTSMPEFVVSLTAALKDKTDVALGNIVGSNISNLGLILGLAAILRPIPINLRILKREMPLVLIATVYFVVLCSNGTVSQVDGLTLFVGFLLYILLVVKGAKKRASSVRKTDEERLHDARNIGRNIVLITIGVIGLTFGAQWMVNSAAEISRRLGVPELMIGLTLIAIGTSLPELATSVIAAMKAESDISVGNILGSNIFNMMAIAGPTAFIHPLPVAYDLIHYHLPMMVGLTVLIFPLLRTDWVLSRGEGAFLLLCYVGIVVWWAIF